MIQKFYAHSVEGEAVEERHFLDEHLKVTGELAASFAAEFECGEWGRLAGLWHDMGKYITEVQFHLSPLPFYGVFCQQ